MMPQPQETTDHSNRPEGAAPGMKIPTDGDGVKDMIKNTADVCNPLVTKLYKAKMNMTVGSCLKCSSISSDSVTYFHCHNETQGTTCPDEIDSGATWRTHPSHGVRSRKGEQLINCEVACLKGAGSSEEDWSDKDKCCCNKVGSCGEGGLPKCMDL